MSNMLQISADTISATNADSGRSFHLADIFLDHKGNISDKWEQYFAVYEIELQRFIEVAKPVQLLEIGVQNGGSLQIWSRYLPAGSSIIGIDIDPKCGELELADNVRIKIGDAGDPEVLDRLLGSRCFDIIIDDGSHLSDDVITTFQACFPRLKPGGIYVIEDLHCSYHASHKGGARKSGTAIEWLKSLVDCLNADYIEDASARMQPKEIHTLFKLNPDLCRVTFYDSIAVVEKLLAPKTGPYRRVITGQSGTIVDPSAIVSQVSNATLGKLLLSESMASAFAPVILRSLAAARDDASKFREAHTQALAEVALLQEKLASYKRRDGKHSRQGSNVSWWRRWFDWK
jgi:hypothetical protein